METQKTYLSGIICVRSSFYYFKTDLYKGTVSVLKTVFKPVKSINKTFIFGIIWSYMIFQKVRRYQQKRWLYHCSIKHGFHCFSIGCRKTTYIFISWIKTLFLFFFSPFISNIISILCPCLKESIINCMLIVLIIKIIISLIGPMRIWMSRPQFHL